MRILTTIVVVIGTAAGAAAQDDPLKAARDLYASAAYVEALAELAHVESAAPSARTARDAGAYRTFCLVALGRDADAQAAAESLVRKDPTLSIDLFPDASPRIATMFQVVRRRVLPDLVKDEYRAARALAIEKAPDAPARLRHVRQLLDTAEHIGAGDDTLTDMRLIVDGFLELAAAAEPPAPAPPLQPPVISLSAQDAVDVVAPIAVFQPQPAVPSALFNLVRQLHRSSKIDVVINEQGTVDDVTVTQAVSPAYDKLIVATARTWRYKPALKGGVPIKFVSSVVIDVNRE